MAAPRTKTYVFSKGDKVWVPEQDECFVIATVKEIKGSNLVAFDEAYKTYTVPVDDVAPINKVVGQGDNCELMHLRDANLLANVRTRYQNKEIYTFTAYILVAVNPYEKLDIYGDAQIREYYGKPTGRMPPHVYALADRAYRSLRNSKRNQSMVVSGESGAGKTESCKHVMRFMAAVGGQGPIGTIDDLEQKVLDANPLLEAFGNAKTLRNNNSSRFGKFTELHFDATFHLNGASIETYLLEKSRVVNQAKGERSFHIFYQLLVGAPGAMRSKLKLQSPEKFAYLKQSECFFIDGVNDKQEFNEVVRAMTVLNIAANDQEQVFSVLAALLYLGNVSFKDIDDASDVDSAGKEAISTAAELLGLSGSELAKRMVTRVMRAGRGEKINITLSALEAGYARDALAKFIYGKLFDYLVVRINQAVPCANAAGFIGILDISGFEIFEINSFEQFCINFANEKIQQYFNRQILEAEQSIYELEGLIYRKVEYQDNQDIIDLVESKRTGVLALLNESCVMPKQTDKTFSIKVHTTHSGNTYLEKPKFGKGIKKRLKEDEAFIIKHFAGDVVYETVNFLDKNNDTIHDELIEVLSTSTSPFVKALFPVEEETPEYGAMGGRFKSVSGRFKIQLTALMDKLYSTTSHFIRCIKPNGMQQPRVFNNNEVMTQLRYSGMCAVLKLMQGGFPTRISFDELYERYAPKMPAMMSRLKPITFCEALLVALDLHGGRDFQMGLTKVFFRAGKLAFMDELTSFNVQSVEAIVAKVRKWLARKRFYAAGYAVVSINRFGRLIEGVRALRKFRRSARFMISMVRVWLPLVARVRKRLYSEEKMKARREEEERRHKAEEEERLRLEAEALARQQAKEEKRRREAEEAKRREEERIRKEEEAKRAIEEKVMQLADGNARLNSQVQSLETSKSDLETSLSALEKTATDLKTQLSSANDTVAAKGHELAKLQERLEQDRATAQKQISELTASMQGDKAALVGDMEKLLSEKSALEKELGDTQSKLSATAHELETVQGHLASTKDSLAQLKEESEANQAALEKTFAEHRADTDGKIAALEQVLGNEQDTSADFAERLSQKTDECEQLTENLAQQTARAEDAETNLKAAVAKGEELDDALRTEKHAREDENHNAAQTLQALQRKTTTDLSVKEAIIDTLKHDKSSLEEKMAAKDAATASQIASLKEQLEASQQDCAEVKAAKAQLQSEHDKVVVRVDLLERERQNLIDVAYHAQETHLKLRSIYSKYKKEEELVRMIFGDDSFNTLAKNANKNGVLQKQGGAELNAKKWAERHMVLNDIFLVYYAHAGDRHCKGIVRLDHCKVEAINLESLTRPWSLKLISHQSGREFFFSAESEEEQQAWVQAIDKCCH